MANENVISGVLCYMKVVEPVNKYQSEEKEFTLDLVVDKATFKEWGKRFPKQKGKAIDTEDFEGIFKIKPPFPDQDEQFVIKMKRPAQYKDGSPLPKQYWPKVLVRNESGKVVPVAEGVLVANGSKGQVSFDVTENSYGNFSRLKNILVTDLIEYKKAGGSDPAADFGLESDNGGDEFASNKSANKAKVEEEDDSIPF